MKIPAKLLIGAAATAFVVSACATIQELAPPIDREMLISTGSDEMSVAQLQRGREIYITDCARCHAPEPVMRYSSKQWSDILPRMAENAALSDGDRGAVAAYINAVMMSRRQSTIDSSANVSAWLPEARGDSAGR